MFLAYYLCLTSFAFAYECVEKTCFFGDCFAETTCTANVTNGCSMEFFIRDIFTSITHNCSETPCEPSWVNLSTLEYTKDCCFSDRCNVDSMILNTIEDPAVDQCYSVICDSENCLENAISEGKARLCPAHAEWGCVTPLRPGGIFSTTCSPMTCNDFQMESINVSCCNGNLCNSPTATPTTDDPDTGKCYSMTCEGEGCLNRAINDGSTGFCSLSPNGYCTSTKLTGKSILESAKCEEDIENEPTRCSNMASHNVPNGMDLVSQCCKTDRCNDGNIKKLPNVEYCYSVQCNGTGCIGKAVQKGIVMYCQQTGFGCVTTTTGEVVVTTCATQMCVDFEIVDISTECCSGDLCNEPQVTTSSTTQSSTRKDTTSKVTITEETMKSSIETSKPRSSTSEPVSSTSQPSSSTKKTTSGARTLDNVLWSHFMFLLFHILFSALAVC